MSTGIILLSSLTFRTGYRSLQSGSITRLHEMVDDYLDPWSGVHCLSDAWDGHNWRDREFTFPATRTAPSFISLLLCTVFTCWVVLACWFICC